MSYESAWVTGFISGPNRMRLLLAKLGRACEKCGSRMRIKRHSYTGINLAIINVLPIVEN